MYCSGIRSFVFVMVLLLAAITGNAQPKCKIERYTTEHGLSHDNVTSILKDRDGFMWFGTWDGINRFDGHNFVAYKSFAGDKSVLRNNRIVSIVEDKAGFLWLRAYNNQIYRFDKKTESFYAFEDLLQQKGFRNVVFTKVVFGQDDCVWLVTQNQGIFCVTKATSAQPAITLFATTQPSGLKLAANQFNFLFSDDANSLWVGHAHGLSKISRNKAGNFTSEIIKSEAVDSLRFTAVTESAATIWFGTGQGYLVVYDKKKKFFSRHKVAEGSLNALLLSKKREVLYLTTSHRQVLTLSLPKLQTSVAAMPGKGAFLSVFEDKAGLLWIEPHDKGVVRFNPVTSDFKLFTQDADATYHPSVKVYRIFEDQQNRVWVSLQGGGFGYYDPKEDALRYFYNEPGSPQQQFSNFVPHAYMDTTGVLWMSTNDRGINKVIFQENYFEHNILLHHTTNKSDNEIRCVFQDSKNRTWFATKSLKLLVYDQDKPITGLFEKPVDFGAGIYCILEDRHNNIWIGTKGNGLFKAVPTDNNRTQYRLTQFLPDQNDSYSISYDQVYSLLEDSKGRIWASTYGGGLNLIENIGGRTRFRNNRNLLNTDLNGFFGKIRYVNEGPNGAIWAGTTDGLLLLTENPEGNFSIRTYQKIAGDKESLGNNDVQYILKDRKNTMWLCTSGGGLNKAVISKDKKLRFKVYTKDDGLPNDYILSAIEDGEGKLWLATENGLSHFDPIQNQFRNYDSYEGLTKANFSENAVARLTNGKLLFGTKNGYFTFNPAELINKKKHGKMAFTAFQVNNKEVEPGDESGLLQQSINHTDRVALAHDQNILGLEFTVLNHQSGNKQEYAYRLFGFDKEWRHVKNQHKAIYTNLPPGDYTFEVKSISPEVYDAVPSKKLAITINPPLWRTTSAYLLYLLLALVLLEIIRRVAFSMIKLRNRIAIEQKMTELKLRFFTNISHELRTPLTLIVNPIEAIAAQDELSAKSREYINVVRKNTNRMVRFINQLLDFRKVQSGKMKLKIAKTDVVALVKEVCSHFTEAASEKQLLLQTTSNVKELYAWLDADKIDIVLYNMLSNALKFTPNGKVITVETNKTGYDTFTIKVIDQGIGVPNDKLSDIFELYYEVDKHQGSPAEGTGIGLALAKEFVELHHGSISAHNNTTEGLTVAVALKTGKEHFKSEEVILLEEQQPESEKFVLPDGTISDSRVLATEAAGKAALPSVLLVEDNHDLRKFLADQLRIAYQVEEAEDGEAGFAKALRLLPDLVISDIMMPKMDGIQLLSKLKNTQSTSHIPVILLTAKTSVEHQIEGLNYGADYYITKPFQIDFILASVKNLLTQRKKIFDTLLTDKKTVALSPGEIVITSKDESFLKEVIRIVENGMSDTEFNIDAVAEQVGMGRTTFYKKFTSLTNLAPVEFVRNMRLKRGKQLLDAGESNISEIAYSVGFNSAGYFSTCFKKKYNTTPSEYIESLKAPQL